MMTSLISLDREPVGAGGPHVHRELLVVTAGDQGGEGDEGAAAAVEAGAGPDAAPGVLGDELLELPGQVGGAGGGPVDVRVAEHLAAYDHAGVAHLADGEVVAGVGGLLAEEVPAQQRGDLLGRLGGRQVRDPVELGVRPVAHAVGDRAEQVGRRRDVVGCPRWPAPVRRSRRGGRARRRWRGRSRPASSPRRRPPGARAAGRSPRRGCARGSRDRTSAPPTRTPSPGCRTC